MHFHSLGELCEFGFAQQRAGVNSIHLFRFIGLHEPVENRLERMVAGLASRFSGLGHPGNIQVFPIQPWNELAFWEARYGLFGHTGVRPEQQSIDETRKKLGVQLAFLRRKFLEDLESGEKILIWRSTVELRRRQIFYLFERLRDFGPNQLVWIPPHDEHGTVGVAEVLADGLVRATMTRRAVLGDLDAATAAEYETICRESLRLLRPEAFEALAAPAPA